MNKALLRGAVISAAALALAGCSDYGPHGYGYGRVSLGYGAPYRSYYGWYGDYYYPGVGVYLYDRSGSRYRWNDSQRHYWEARRDDRYERRENWSGYRGHHGSDRDDRGGRGHRRH